MTTATRAKKEIKAPFPYPGGKSRVASLVWDRFGNVDNYVEPFAGSLAMLLKRPAEHFTDGYRVETVNDANHFIVNFWRAVKAGPDAVAEYADGPVIEADLHARHRWLMRSDFAAGWRKRMAEDPDHYDAKVAGWWVWGQCCWIGSGWCDDGKYERSKSCKPNTKADRIGEGVHGNGRPQLADAYDIGRGVNAGGGLSEKIPRLSTALGNGGVNATVALPQPGICDARRAWLRDWMRRLADRLRCVRTLYGHWDRACDSDSTLTRLGTTGVFLDPPYPARSVCGKKSRDPNLYATDKGADLDALRDEVLAWCVKWGGDPQIKIAVCGYEGDGYEALESGHGWEAVEWEASGGYANQRRANKGKAANAKRERIWFSPAAKPQQRGLFE